VRQLLGTLLVGGGYRLWVVPDPGLCGLACDRVETDRMWSFGSASAKPLQSVPMRGDVAVVTAIIESAQSGGSHLFVNPDSSRLAG